MSRFKQAVFALQQQGGRNIAPRGFFRNRNAVCAGATKDAAERANWQDEKDRNSRQRNDRQDELRRLPDLDLSFGR
jgi:hypothetical protein